MPTPDLSLLIYCRDDSPGSRWVGQDALLSEFQCDQNIFTLANVSQWLLDNYQTTVSLASVSQPTASTILFTFTDSSTQGPFDLPTATFRDRVDWAIDTPYLVNDTFNAPDGGLYRVTFAHTSSHTSFDPAANDGMGHDYYAPMIPPRGNVFPAGGAVGMYLRKNSTTDYDFNAAFISASEVRFFPSTSSALISTTVSDAIEEVALLVTTSAAGISFAPSTDTWLVSTTVSDALEELSHINALHVLFTPTTDSALVSTNISDAVEELEALIGSGGGSLDTLSDVNVTEGAGIDGEVLYWDNGASKWQSKAVQASDSDLTALAGNSTNGLWARTGSGTGAARTITQSTGITVTNGDGVSGDPTVAVTSAISTGAIEVVIDGGGSTITTGLKGYLNLPIAGTITEAKLLADQSGSIVVDIFKCTYAQFDAGSTHPVSGDKITASAPPTITTATKSQDTTLTGWSTAFSAGDVLAFNVNSATTITRVTLSLKYTK